MSVTNLVASLSCFCGLFWLTDRMVPRIRCLSLFLEISNQNWAPIDIAYAWTVVEYLLRMPSRWAVGANGSQEELGYLGLIGSMHTT